MAKAILIVSVLAACGGGGKKAADPLASVQSACTPDTKPSHPTVASCTQHQAGGDYCAEFTGTNSADEDQKVCTEIFKGDFAAAPCKAEGVVARCLAQCGKPLEGVNTYYYGDVAALQDNCGKTKGTWLTAAP